MRILITPEWYPWPDRPVYGAFCREQARAVAQIHDVAVLTWRMDPMLRAPFRLKISCEEGLLTCRVCFGRTRLPKDGFRLAGCVGALLRLRRAGWTPDVIHAHEYVAGPVALTLGALARVPVVFSEHLSAFALGALSDQELLKARKAFERAALVCPVSQDLTAHIRAVAPGARLQPVPNAVDTDVFVPAAGSGPSGTPRLVTVGALVPLKGHVHLIGALARLRERGVDVKLDVIGDGPLRSDLELLARDIAVDDRVSFRGIKPKLAVAAALRDADAFVLPSLWETQSCAVLEAMSAGLPVVATRVGGVPEVVDGTGGLLVAPGSADALADAIAHVVRGPGGHDAAAVRARAVATFGYAAVARRWTSVYAAALGAAG